MSRSHRLLLAALVCIPLGGIPLNTLTTPTAAAHAPGALTIRAAVLHAPRSGLEYRGALVPR